jgi:phosphoribosyl-AMP cyclohydrolase
LFCTYKAKGIRLARACRNASYGVMAEGKMDFAKLGGLLPAVVQDETSNEVLMVGFMNEDAWRLTRDTGYVTFYSRTRQKLWMKGETSGNRLLVQQVLLDCDEDTVLLKVRREGEGNVCHLNRVSCFVPTRLVAPELPDDGALGSGGGR